MDTDAVQCGGVLEIPDACNRRGEPPGSSASTGEPRLIARIRWEAGCWKNMIEAVCRDAGIDPPLLCTPEQLVVAEEDDET